MVLDASLLNTQHYKVEIKGKVEQSRERSSALPYTLVGVVANEKEAFGLHSTTVANFTFLLYSLWPLILVTFCAVGYALCMIIIMVENIIGKFKPVVLHLKIDLESYLACDGGVG